MKKTVEKNQRPAQRRETDDARLFREAVDSITLKDILRQRKDPTHGLGRRMLEEAEARGQTLTDDDALSLLEDREGFEADLRKYGNFEPRQNGPKVFLVLGVSGSGKSPSIRQAVKLLGSKVNEVNFGDEMGRVAFGDSRVSKNQLRNLPPEEQERLRVRTAKKIAGMCSDPNTVYCIESHATLYGSSGFIVSLGSEVFNTLRPNGMFMVSQDPELILEKRPGKLLADKKVHQRVDEAIIGEISAASGVPLHIIEREGLDLGRKSGREIAHIIYSDEHKI